jgi:hypothetical protein
MALINPQIRFVGIAGVSAQWQRNACAGAFGESGNPGEHADTGSPGESADSRETESVWMIPLRRDLLPEAIGRALEVAARRIRRAAIL